MNGLSADAAALARDVAAGAGEAPSGVELVICPPALHLASAKAAIAGTPALLGGQDCHEADAGAHTGDMSAEMLRDIGCTHVIVGHSERRENHGEGDALVWRKATAALRAGLTAVICVGETEQERLAGQAEETVAKQVRAAVPDGADGARVALAYEPVWAIGSGRTPTLDEISAVHGTMRRALIDLLGEASGGGVRLLYGGSVKPGNAKEIMALEHVNGALVGGASLNADDFLAIAAATA